MEKRRVLSAEEKRVRLNLRKWGFNPLEINALLKIMEEKPLDGSRSKEPKTNKSSI